MASAHAFSQCNNLSSFIGSFRRASGGHPESTGSSRPAGNEASGSGPGVLRGPFLLLNSRSLCIQSCLRNNFGSHTSGFVSGSQKFVAESGTQSSRKHTTNSTKVTESRLAQYSEKKQKLAFQPKNATTLLDEIDSVAKEPHKYFDQAVITVKAGDGGNGAVIKKTKKKPASKGRKGSTSSKRPKTKRGPDGEIQLPMGGGGGDVVLYADENLETLLEFHRKKKFQGGRGGNVDAMHGLAGDLFTGTDAPVLRVPVPVGKTSCS
jgi:hypothetical protein